MKHLILMLALSSAPAMAGAPFKLTETSLDVSVSRCQSTAAVQSCTTDTDCILKTAICLDQRTKRPVDLTIVFTDDQAGYFVLTTQGRRYLCPKTGSCFRGL
jgi:hypothetical protein